MKASQGALPLFPSLAGVAVRLSGGVWHTCGILSPGLDGGGLNTLFFSLKRKRSVRACVEENVFNDEKYTEKLLNPRRIVEHGFQA